MATEVVIPMLGVTIETGIIVEWLKKEGEPVQKGESLFIVEADKVVTEVEAPASGILAKILLPVGQKVPVLTIVAIITEPGEELPEEYREPPAAGRRATARDEARNDGVEAINEPAKAHAPLLQKTSDGTPRAVPAARKLAREKGIDLARVQGSGPEGVILYKDVADAVKTPHATASRLARHAAAKAGIDLKGITGSGVRGRIMKSDVDLAVKEAAAPRLGKVVQMDRMRQVIARRMAESAFTAPHIHFFSEVRMDALLSFRQQLLPDFEARYQLRPSINDFLIKAAALTIRDFPMMNATLRGEEIHILPEINICLAVALTGGLITPAIPSADRCGLCEIVRHREDLVRRARAGMLNLDEIERGTFTISSLAQYDITHFTAILNPPQSGILSVGKTRSQLELNNGQLTSVQTCMLGLSVDHRIIDGAMAAEFLQNLKWRLEKPTFSFLHV